MTNLHSLSTGFYCVELPEGAEKIEVSDSALMYECIAFDEPYQELTLPAGTWSFLGMASDVPESECRLMVEKDEGLYRHYEKGETHVYTTAIESLQSKIRSLGIEPKRAGIIKCIPNAPSQG